jgi:hypothetical protein
MPFLEYSRETQRKKKVIVFDLDETLGSFGEFFEIWNMLFTIQSPETHKSKSYLTLKKEMFFQLAELYPEFFRPHIFQLLKYVYSKIVKGECEYVYLYTNNQCTYPEWVELLIYYMTAKIAKLNSDGTFSPPLFARPVCAFKIHDKIIEQGRTSHLKKHADFISCTLLPRHIEICYIDDKYYTDMVHDKVYYIQPPPYYHPLSHNIIYERLLSSDVLAVMLKHNIITLSPQNPFQNRVFNNSRVLSDTENHHIHTKMMYYLKEFFILTTRRPTTRKHNQKLGRFTKRKKQ